MENTGVDKMNLFGNKGLLASKNRFKKVIITDVAIAKVPLVGYKGLSDGQNRVMQALCRQVLLASQRKNNSNEVAITCNLTKCNDLGDYGVSYGTEHDVNVLSDALSYHLIMTGNINSVVIIHNHPSTQTFSLADIRFLLSYSTIGIIIVVSNQGKVHYLIKDIRYEREAARVLYNQCVGAIESEDSVVEYYHDALDFLSMCSEVGLYYQ